MFTTLELVLVIVTVVLIATLIYLICLVVHMGSELNKQSFESWFQNDKIEDLQKHIEKLRTFNDSLLEQVSNYQDTLTKLQRKIRRTPKYTE